MQHLENWALLLLCSVSGLVIVMGSITLLWFRRISFDHEGVNQSEIDFFGKIKLKTHYPVLLMFMFGGALLVYPAYRSVEACIDPAAHKMKPLRLVALRGPVGGDGVGVQAFAVCDSQTARPGQDIDLRVPFIDDHHYTVKYVNPANGMFMSEEEFYLENGEKTRPLHGVSTAAGAVGAPAVKPQVEQKSVIDEFNRGGGQ